MKRKILITAGILMLLAILSVVIDSDIILDGFILLYILALCGLILWIVFFVICLLTAFISLPLRLIDWLVFKVWLGRKTDKYDRFHELSTLWLTCSYKLPTKMHKRGAKYGWLGAGLMLVSPMALATYTVVFCVLQAYFPFPLSEKDVPYKTHEDLVAITGLSDFPAFTYSHNERERKNEWRRQDLLRF